MTTYCIAVFICYIADCLLTLCVNDHKKPSTKPNEKTKPRNIVQNLVKTATYPMILIFIHKYQVELAMNIILFFAMVVFIAVLIYAIFNFVKYLTINSFDFELTKKREIVLKLVGFFTLFVCQDIVRNNLVRQLQRKQFFNRQSVFPDLQLMIVLTFWYFAACFFTLAFVVLALHKFAVILNSRTNFYKMLTPKKQHIKRNKTISLANLIAKQIDALNIEKKWKKVCWYIPWFISLLVDVLFIDPLFSFFQLLRNVGTFFLSKVQLQLKRLLNALVRNQGEFIIIVSRFSIIVSLLLVNWMDRYLEILSEPGSKIYEFISGVIVIPLLITQIAELKRMRKDNAEQLSAEQ
ncbi:MAG: hypothetical protein ACOX4A_00220 [Saccharofermentanales bacterium]